MGPVNEHIFGSDEFYAVQGIIGTKHTDTLVQSSIWLETKENLTLFGVCIGEDSVFWTV